MVALERWSFMWPPTAKGKSRKYGGRLISEPRCSEGAISKHLALPVIEIISWEELQLLIKLKENKCQLK